jgi:protein kinase-like protein
MKACPNCHSKYPDDANFCPQETCATPQGPRRLETVPAEPAPRFQLTSKLGGGRSGEVWVARDSQTGDDVAYKLVTPEVLPTPAASERAQRELKQLQRAQNPHLARIVDFGRSGDGRLFVATELANGQPLDRLVQGAGALPVDRAKKIVAQIGEALLEGQKVGVVHHDLSAKNVLVGPDDAVKVINFVTPWPITDTIFGVPEYLSPEQAEGKLVDQRSNTYSLGAILQLMLTGQPPVSGGDVQTVLAQIIQGTVTPPSQLRQGLTPEIDRVVLKAMEKNSSRRPLTMRQFLAEVAGVVGLPAGPAAAPTAGTKGAAFAKTMMFAGGAPEVQNLVNQAQAARDAANGAAAAAAASAAASLPKAPTPAPVADPAAAARRTHGAAVAATMMAIPSAASGPLPGALPPAEPRPAPTPAPAMQAAAPSGGGGGGAGAGGGGGAAGGGGGSGGGGGGGGAGFRETLWFKKGDVEQMVAEAKAKAAAAAAKGKPAPVVEEAPVEDVKPLEDRYKDDGSVTVEDRKKFSLRSGGTAAGLPVVGGVVPGERMSDNEMINEIGGGKKIAIIGVAVAVVAIIVAVIMMSMHKKHDAAAAAEAPAAKAAEMAAAAPAPAAPAAPAPAAPAAAPAPIAAAPAEAPAAAETPPKAQAGPAHKHVAKAAKKKSGKKHH